MPFRSPDDARAKLKSAAELRALIAACRSKRRTVVFANGCFDLIHVGHVRYLEGASSQGEVLVVAINSDASVSKLKGKGRPLQTESERVEILGSFDCVDYTVIFDELTVDGLLSELRPDIQVKGTDYQCETVPERATVRAYGGRVAIVGDAKSHSSRDLIESILSKCRR